MKHIYTLQNVITIVCLAITGFAFGQVTTFDYTGSIETYTVPDGVTSIRIEAKGAQGGGGMMDVTGGLGAIMIGDFDVTGGEELQILVGGQGIDGTDVGQQAGGTGGGGSFVVNAADEPLIIAGGGGGAMGRSGLPVNGGPGQTSEAGQDGGTDGGAGGTDGDGGGTWPWTGWHSGTGGGGFYTDGSADSNGSMSFGTINGRGKSFLSGGDGGFGGSLGRDGGFGGGGAAGFTVGGGGYSGGGSGTHDSPPSHSGGGGGSFNAGTDQDNTAGANSGNGQIIITELCVELEITATDEEICFGESLTLEATGEGTITWDGDVLDGEEFTPDEEGTLTYTATSDDDEYCPTSIEIEVFALPEVTANADLTEICEGGTVTLTGDGADEYNWDPMDVTDG